MDNAPLIPYLRSAVEARSPLFDARHDTAFRIFNGFTEGEPSLGIDVYGSTLVFHDYAEDASKGHRLVQQAQDYLRSQLSWLRAGLVKRRNSDSQEERRGKYAFGDVSDRKIREHDVWYAVDLMMNRDASFYLDTRTLRKWLIDHMHGKTVLNTFAYTGSLGVAATAGHAKKVVQLDRSRQFLSVAKDSYALNGFPIHKGDFIAADFFPAIGQFKRTGRTFDCVILDPPFFSSTSRGRVDQQTESARLINKIRPLINDGGILVAINNALYVSGKEYIHTLEALCSDGYLQVEELIPVPQDFIGYHNVGTQVTDPSPFNHSTKIAILSVKRKRT
jgi:23S rRNA (cytosine1962-C5)-methyltransferase